MDGEYTVGEMVAAGAVGFVVGAVVLGIFLHVVEDVELKGPVGAMLAGEGTAAK